MKGSPQHERRASPWRIASWTLAAILILLPLVAMQFTDEVNWTAGDFVFAILLILSVGVPLELVVRRTRSLTRRTAVRLALAVWFLIVWITGAVGIIGSEGNPANLMYFGVVAIGATGAVIARFRSRGMARAMVAAALALIAVAVVALVTGWGSEEPAWPWPVLIMNGFLAALLGGAAALFWRVAREETPPRAGPE